MGSFLEVFHEACVPAKRRMLHILKSSSLKSDLYRLNIENLALKLREP